MLNSTKSIKITKSPLVLFAPFLLLYIILAIVFPSDGMSGDERRYLLYARYLINGFLSPSEADIDILGNGPGYSIILMPFVALHLPLIWITIMNCVFHYFSIVLLFNTSIKIVSFRKALLLSLFWACYYNSYENILLILPETFTAFLICLLIFYLVEAFNPENSKKQKKFILLSGIIIGYIALTKPIFGYVLLFMLICCGFLWIIKRKTINYRGGIIILLIALAATTPYLIYTYHLTGKIFYWSTFGGNNLYWMSTPFEGEYGNWLPNPHPLSDSISQKNHYSRFEKYIKSDRTQNIIGDYRDYSEYINHKKDFDEINKYKGVEQDDAYKKIAINNIKSHPIKFVQNGISNIGRIIFNYPYSYKLQSPGTLLRFPFNGIIATLMLFCLIPTFKNWKKIIFSIRFMLIFTLLYLGGSVLACAETRMFTVIVPMLLIWINYVIQKAVKINIKW